MGSLSLSRQWRILLAIVISILLLCTLVINPSDAAKQPLTYPSPTLAHPEKMFDDKGPTEDPSLTAPNIELLHSDDEGVILEFTTHSYEIVSVSNSSGKCDQITIPGLLTLEEPGLPSLPLMGTMVRIPTLASPRLSIIEAESEILPQEYALCPPPEPILDILASTPDQSPEWEQSTGAPVANSSDMLYPTQQVEITELGGIRDQHVAQIRFYPIQYDPITGKVQITHRLRVELQFQSPAAADSSPNAAAERIDTSPFESLLEDQLINYSTAVRWRAAPHNINTSRTAATPSRALGYDYPAYRIETDTSGFYRLSYEDLRAADAGVDLNGIDPAKIHLWNDGQEIAIEVENSTSGVFGPGDQIHFYAQAINTKYTATNIYWLT